MSEASHGWRVLRWLGPGGAPDAGQRYAAAVSIGSRAIVRGMIEAPGTGRRPGARPADRRRWLAWHEATSHGLLGREVRRRSATACSSTTRPTASRSGTGSPGIAWPARAGGVRPPPDRGAGAVRRSLDRIPHVWPMPGIRRAGRPRRAPARRRLRGPRRRDADGARPGPRSTAHRNGRNGDLPARPDVTVERLHRLAGHVADEAARGIAIVLAEAFARRAATASVAIEHETLALLGRDEFHAVLVRVDGEPAATARRTTFAGASYLSSIGTRPAFRGLGLGRLVSAVAMHDALAAGSRWTYLGVFDDNLVARRMYEGLGFAVLGGPAPDLLLAVMTADLPARPEPVVAARTWQAVDVERGTVARPRRCRRSRSPTTRCWARAASSSGAPRGAAARDRRAVHGRPARGRARASRRGRPRARTSRPRAARPTHGRRGRSSSSGPVRARSVGRRSSRGPAPDRGRRSSSSCDRQPATIER